MLVFKFLLEELDGFDSTPAEKQLIFIFINRFLSAHAADLDGRESEAVLAVLVARETKLLPLVWRLISTVFLMFHFKNILATFM